MNCCRRRGGSKPNDTTRLERLRVSLRMDDAGAVPDVDGRPVGGYVPAEWPNSPPKRLLCQPELQREFRTRSYLAPQAFED